MTADYDLNAHLDEDGAVLLPNAVSSAQLDEIEPLFGLLGESQAGHRLPSAKVAGLSAVRSLATIISEILGGEARPVRALLFDKRAGSNWALGWHQDRTIEVVEHRDVPGFGPWTIKAGRHHVGPPVSLLEQMITARIHLDAVDGDNAPLIVAAGSHRRGIIAESEIKFVVAGSNDLVCLAEPGDVWLYHTLILHASGAARRPTRRRVLQLDFAGSALPGGLEWASIA